MFLGLQASGPGPVEELLPSEGDSLLGQMESVWRKWPRVIYPVTVIEK